MNAKELRQAAVGQQGLSRLTLGRKAGSSLEPVRIRPRRMDGTLKKSPLIRSVFD